MIIYLMGFVISLLLLWAAEKTPSNSSTYNTFIVIAILIPAMIAGARGETVGTDVTVYVKQMTNAAIQSDTFIGYYRSGWINWDFSGGYAYTYDYEPGFILLIYIVAKCFRNLNAVLFVIHLFITIFVYKGLKHYSNRIHVWLGMAVFYFMNYNTSLNMMRQWMAMAILFYGVYYIKKDTRKYVAFVAASTCFHISGLVCGILIFLVAQYTMNASSHMTQTKAREQSFVGGRGRFYIHRYTLRLIVMVAVIFIVIICLPYMVQIMERVGLHRYIAYVNGKISFMPNQLIMRFPFYVLIGLGYNRFRRSTDLSYFLLAMIILDTLFSQLSGISTYSVRITAYFNMFYMLSLPLACSGRDKADYNTGTVMLLFVSLIFYWVYFYVYRAYGQTVPYIAFWNT